METCPAGDVGRRGDSGFRSNAGRTACLTGGTGDSMPKTGDRPIQATRLGPLTCAKFHALPAEVHRPERNISPLPHRPFSLHVQIRGQSWLRQKGQEVVLQEGDFTLCDGAAPYQLAYHDPCSSIVIGIPLDLLRQYIPHPEHFTCAHMSGSEGLSSVASHMMRSLWTQVELGVPEDLAPRLAENVLSVLGTAYRALGGRTASTSAVKSGRMAQIKHFIEAHLRDPDLTPRKISTALHISPRYLHLLFAEEKESISHYVLRRRLEECARQIRDDFWHHRTITEIAFDWGFNSASHFARVFKKRFNESPREYRNRHLGLAARQGVTALE